MNCNERQRICFSFRAYPGHVFRALRGDIVTYAPSDDIWLVRQEHERVLQMFEDKENNTALDDIGTLEADRNGMYHYGDGLDIEVVMQ